MAAKKLCMFCQQVTEEEVVCPLDNPVAVRRKNAYRDIITLVHQFIEVDALPHPNFEPPDEETMERNRASWHKTFCQLYKASALDRAKNRYLLPSAKKRPKRSKNQNKCLFCGEETSRADHSFQKLSSLKIFMTKQLHLERIVL